MGCVFDGGNQNHEKQDPQTLLHPGRQRGLSLDSPSQLKAQAIIGSDVKLPQVVAQPAPDYSVDLRREGVEGQVVVSFVVTAAGEVSHPVIVSSTDPRLGRPTLVALRNWKYRPATKAGVPVPTRVIETVQYQIRDAY